MRLDRGFDMEFLESLLAWSVVEKHRDWDICFKLKFGLGGCKESLEEPEPVMCSVGGEP